MKKLIFGISGAVSFLVFLIFTLVAGRLGNSQPSQEMAKRWSPDGEAAQVSCFFSVNAYITQDKILEFEHSIDSALKDAGVLQESENPGARLWADAYSADGKITVSTENGKVEADAIGIGGDFFLFHPEKLLYGAYFSGNDLMQDYCVIDEDAAWQLFGSPNVAGKTVYINGVPHIVTGVVQRADGILEKKAGLDSTVIYVSYQTLSELGSCNGINHYEIVMPNPVSDFAYQFIEEKLGTDEKETEVVENSGRYSFLSELKILRQFGARSMNAKAIIYPYWENVARGVEDILALITLFQLLFLTYAVIVALVLFVKWWKHKGWTIKEKLLGLKDKAERRLEKHREARVKQKDIAEVQPKEKKPSKVKWQPKERFKEKMQLSGRKPAEEQSINGVEEEKK